MKNPATPCIALFLVCSACVDAPDVDYTGQSITVDEVFEGPDGDGDGLPDLIDNCPQTPNPSGFDAAIIGGSYHMVGEQREWQQRVLTWLERARASRRARAGRGR